MTIQSISSAYQAQPSMKADLRDLIQSMKALKNATNTNNQDQITLSQNALIKAAGQVQNDISGITSGQPAGSSNQVQNAGNGKISNLQSDLQTLHNALNSTNQGGPAQSTTIANAVSKVSDDITGLHKGHGHHPHVGNMNSANSGSSVNNSDTMSSLAALFGVGIQNSGNALNMTA